MAAFLYLFAEIRISAKALSKTFYQVKTMKLKEKAKKLKQDIPTVFLALRHRRTPWYAKALAAVTIAYALSPVDLIPDFIPVLGYLDDVILLPALIVATLRCIPKDVLDECRKESEEIWKDGKPAKWFYAMPIIIIWLLIFLAIGIRVYHAVQHK